MQSAFHILFRLLKYEMRIFEVLFKGVITRFRLRTIEKLIETPHFISCSSFQNLRLGRMNLMGVSFVL